MAYQPLGQVCHIESKIFNTFTIFLQSRASFGGKGTILSIDNNKTEGLRGLKKASDGEELINHNTHREFMIQT
jgi:hypothetical protein